MQCIKTDGSGNFSMVKCDITDVNQLFRVYRSNYGQPATPNNGNNITNNTGLVGTYGNSAQIFSRVDNQCVIADVDTGKLILGPCSSSSWGLFPRQNGLTSTNLAVQQIAYIGNLTDEQKTNLFNARMSDDLYTLMAEYNVQVMALDGTSISLSPYTSFPPVLYTNSQDLLAGQIVDYTLYNTILFGTTYVSF
jgi:hypothetical protein